MTQQTSSAFHTRNAVIDVSEDAVYSEVIDFTRWSFVAVRVPADLEGTTLRVLGSDAPDGTFSRVFKDDTEVGGTYTAGTWMVLHMWMPFPYLKFYLDDGAGTPATQTGDATLEIIMRS